MGGISNPEPFLSVTIANGLFSVRHYGAMGSSYWERKTTFKYQANEKMFYLDEEYLYRGRYSEIDSEMTGQEVLKTKADFGMIPFEKYDVYR